MPEQVSFEELFAAATLAYPNRSGRARHRRPRRDTWLCLAERVLGSWAPTLRASVLLLVAAACLLATAAATFGVLGVVVYLATCGLAWLMPHRRTHRQHA